MNKKKANKTTLLHNLMIHAINGLLERDLITLEYPHDLSSCTPDKDLPPKERGYTVFEIGGFKSYVSWKNCGNGELKVLVWFDADLDALEASGKTYGCTARGIAENSSPRFIFSLLSFASAVVGCYLERKAGRYIQCPNGKTFNGLMRYLNPKKRDRLESLPMVSPNGYAAAGKFFL